MTGPEPRMTPATQRVVATMLEHGTEMYGRQIAVATGLGSGTVKPIIDRLEAGGWVVSRWERGDAHDLHRPRRRYFRLTPLGVTEAREI